MNGESPLRSGAGGAQLVAPPPAATHTSAPTEEPTVSRVSAAPASPEAMLFGVVLGGLSAVLAVAAFGYAPGQALNALVPAAIFLVVWAVASWFLTRDTGRVLVVLRRGFLLGAIQWAQLSMTWVGTPTPGQGVLLGTLNSILTSGVASFLIWSSVVGFIGCWFLTRSPYRELVSDRP